MNNKKLNISLFYAITLLQGMVFYGPIATLYRQAQGLSMFDITLIESISLVGMLMLEIPWGYLADKIGYKNTILICNILFFISKLIFWKANGFSLFLLERLILAVVLSGLSGCDSAYLYILAGEKNSQKVFGTYGAMSAGGLVFASVVFSGIIKDNYRLAAFFTVLSYMAAMIISFFLTDVKPKPTKRIHFSQQLKMIIASLWQNKQFMLFLLAATLLTESNQTITVFLNQLQYLRSGILPQYMGYLDIVVAAAVLFSAYSHRLIVWLGETGAAKFLFWMAGVACAVMALSSHPMTSILGMVLLRTSASLFAPLSLDIQNRQVRTPNRAMMLSTYGMVMNLMAVGTNLLFGKVADIGVPYSMALGSVFCFGGLIIFSMRDKKLMQFTKFM